MSAIEDCLREGDPPLPWLFEVAARVEGEDLQTMLSDAGALSRSLATVADLFDLPAVCTSFDTALEAEAAGCTVEVDGEGARVVEGSVRTVDDAMDVDVDGIVDAGRVPAFLDAAERLVATLDGASVLGGVTGPAALTRALLAEPDPGEEVVDEAMFTASGAMLSLANAYLDRDVDGIVVLEPGGVDRTDRYVDEVVPLANVLDHYDATGVLVQREVAAEDVALAAEAGFDAITGRVDDPAAVVEAATDRGIVLGAGVPRERFLDGTADEFAEGLPPEVLVSSEWTVPAGTAPEAVHGIMGSLG